MEKVSVLFVMNPHTDFTHNRTFTKLEWCSDKQCGCYCKGQLEKYSNVTVYMTRNSMACPYPGTTLGQCNLSRVNYAASVGTDMYASIHLNSAGSTSASGAEVYYPNGNYRPDLGMQGQNVAQFVPNKLVSLGLRSRRIKIRNFTDADCYPDGTRLGIADVFG